MKNLLFAATIVSILSLFQCKKSTPNTEVLSVNSSNPNIEYTGRIDSTSSDGVDLYWSSSSIKINFEGDSIKALLQDDSGDNYYNIIIDSDSVRILRPDTSKTEYLLASNLSEGKHTLELFRRTEYFPGKTTFFNFKIYGNAKLLPKPEEKKRKIEYYGNSISAGYAVEDFSGRDSPDSTYTNNYLSYVALVARHYNADYQCICRSGIGITTSWPVDTLVYTMPEIYDRTIPTDSTSTWDFSNYKPDIVVVNLFQNDSWLVERPDFISFKAKFGTEKPSEEIIIESYKSFISKLRQHYPNTNIICTLGNMDATKVGSPWPNYIARAVEELNDDKIYAHFVPFKETPGHPSIKEQEDIAKSLIKFIDEHIEW